MCDHPAPAELAASPAGSIEGRRVCLVGRFASVSRRETAAAVVRRGAVLDAERPEWVIVGEESGPEVCDEARREAREAGAELLSESELWRRLGLVDDSVGVRRLYSPAMLAELVGAPLAAVRHWARRGVLRPACRVNRLLYFDFAEARVAQLLAELLRQRGSLAAVDRRVDRLEAAHPATDRPLADLPLAAADGEFVVRREAGLSEPGGQRRLDFESPLDPDKRPPPAVLRMVPLHAAPPSLRDRAWGLFESGDSAGAIEAWRLAMLESPPAADDHFTLAEWLYRDGQLAAARERYYATIEADGDHLEARVSLGCVLAELGDRDLAIASLRGAVEQDAGFADAHYHLARVLQSAGEDAAESWRTFLALAPESPWADEARRGLAARDGSPAGG